MSQKPGDPVGSFTGRRYSRKPRTSVLLADRVARRLITTSGIGGIAAVSLVGLFLVWVAFPLLKPARLEPEATGVGAAGAETAHAVAVRIDNYGTMSWSLLPEGRLVVQDLGSGAVLQRLEMAPGLVPTAATSGGDRLVLGFGDGSIVTAAVEFASEYLTDDAITDELRAMPVGGIRPLGSGLVARTPEGQWRHQEVTLTIDPPVDLGESPITLVDVTVTTSGMMVAALDSAGTFHQRLVTWKRNMLTGETTARVQGDDVSLVADSASAFTSLKLNDTGAFAALLTAAGGLVTLADEGNGFAVAGRQDLAPEPGVKVTAVTFLAGKVSLAVGDERGGVGIWFPVAGTDGRNRELACARRLEAGTAAVTALGVSERSRMLVVGYADGSLQVLVRLPDA